MWPISFNPAKGGLANGDLESFLTNLARLLSPEGTVKDEHKLRKPDERFLDYVLRQYIEHDCVVYDHNDIGSHKDQRHITQEIYQYMTQHENASVQQIIKICLSVNSLSPITSRDKLKMLADRLDKMVVNTEKSEEFSAFQSNNTQYSKPRFEQDIYQDPQISIKTNQAICKSCKNDFVPEKEDHELCKNCFIYKLQTINRIKTETKEKERGRNTFRQTSQSRGRSSSRDKSRGNAYNNYSRNNMGQRFSSLNIQENHNQNESDDSDDSIWITEPLLGNEMVNFDPNLFSNCSDMLSAMRHNVSVTRGDRICMEFNHDLSNNRGNALVDSGATTDTIKVKFINQSNIKMIDNTEGHAKDFRGVRSQTLGKARVTITLGKLHYTADFTVIDSSSHIDIILGVPFMRTYGIDDIIRSNLLQLTGDNCVLKGEPKN